MTGVVRIGTRGSELALWQARKVAEDLQQRLGIRCQLVTIHTTGDRDRTRALHQVGGSGLFTKELQAALLAGQVDLVVHSLKDLPTEEPPGAVLAAVCFREDPSELLLARKEAVGPGGLGLKANAVLGTSSLRRRAQALALQPDLQVRDLRGNVPTRVRKLMAGEYDAILLAYAGVHRLQLDLGGLVVRRLPLDLMLPAPAQGALGVEVRIGDQVTRSLVSHLHDQELAEEVRAERTVLVGLGGGCHLPLAAYCQRKNGAYHLRAALGLLDQHLGLVRLLKAEATASSPQEAARQVLAELGS